MAGRLATTAPTRARSAETAIGCVLALYQDSNCSNGRNAYVNRDGMTETTAGTANDSDADSVRLRTCNRAERHHGRKDEHQQSTGVGIKGKNRNGQGRIY